MALLWLLQGTLNGLEDMSEFCPMMQRYIEVLCWLWCRFFAQLCCAVYVCTKLWAQLRHFLTHIHLLMLVLVDDSKLIIPRAHDLTACVLTVGLHAGSKGGRLATRSALQACS